MPRLSNSRIAAALLGIRFAKRHVSTIRSSACVNDLEPFASIEFTHLTLPVKTHPLNAKNPKLVPYPFYSLISFVGFGQ